MVVIRPTIALAKRMKAQLSEHTSPSSTLLGDWYAIEIILERRQFILCISEHTMLPVVLPAAPYATLPERLPVAVAAVLTKLGVTQASIASELDQMKTYAIAKTANRSVLGTLKEFRFMLECDGLGTPLDMALHLANGIAMALPEKIPAEATLLRFNQRPRPKLRLV